MRRNKSFGAASCLLGALALAFAVSIFHIERFQTFDPHRQAVVLGLFDRLGFVKAPDMQAQMSISPVGLISLTDANAVEFIRIYAWWFSLCAIGVALFAEIQRESTLLLSIGCVSGCFAVLFLGGAGWVLIRNFLASIPLEVYALCLGGVPQECGLLRGMAKQRISWF